MKQLIITILIFPLLWSCNNQINVDASGDIFDQIEATNDQSVVITNTKDEWNYKDVYQKYFDTLMMDICLTEGIEFLDLYPIIDSIPSGKYEKLILIDSLKTRDFKVTSRGRGNWVYGPRIVSFTMSNKQCECLVDKLYYSTDKKGKYKVTERIKCKKANW